MVTLLDLGDRLERVSAHQDNYGAEVPVHYINLVEPNHNLVKGFDVVVHLAALAHVDFSFQYPDLTLSNNILSTIHVLSSAAREGTPVVMASSAEIYGGYEKPPYTEKSEVSAFSPYGVSKVAAEAIAENYRKCFGLRYVTMRFSNMFGPWQAPDRVIPRLICRALHGQELQVSAGVVRDFLFVEDAVTAIELVLERDHWGATYNVASGVGIGLYALAQMIIEAVGHGGAIIERESSTTMYRNPSLVLSSEKISRELGWRPVVSLCSGIQKTSDWYKAHSRWWSKHNTEVSAEVGGKAFLIDRIVADAPTADCGQEGD
jgi:dTDP-glucose 4,6-dehydratase